MPYSENASWIIEVGDVVLHHEANAGYSNLTEIEKLVICFWSLDYAVRNAGCLGPLEDDGEPYLSDLSRLSQIFGLVNISQILNAKTDVEVQNLYYSSFEQNCETIKKYYVPLN